MSLLPAREGEKKPTVDISFSQCEERARLACLLDNDRSFITVGGREGKCRGHAHHRPSGIQRSAKVDAPGLVNFIPAVAYHFCLNCLQHSRNLECHLLPISVQQGVKASVIESRGQRPLLMNILQRRNDVITHFIRDRGSSLWRESTWAD